MGKKGGAEVNSKKAAGQARKQEAAARKEAERRAEQEAREAAEWAVGAKKKSAKK